MLSRRGLLASALGSIAWRARAADGPLSLQATEVADGVHAFLGNGQEASPANRGVVANSACVVGRDGVLVINSGSSRRYGVAQLEAIARITSLPVRGLLLTQQAPEFVFGATEYRARGIPIHAHARAAQAIEAQCAVCLKRLVETLGADEMRGSEVTVPDRSFEGDWRFDLGGRSVDILSLGHASSPGDVVAFDRTASVLMAGSVASIGRIPQLRQEDYGGWVAATTRLEELGARWLVPGFGPVGPPSQLARTREYLQALDASLRRALSRGFSLVEARERVRLPRFADWHGVETLHVENVQRRFLQLESGSTD